MQSIQILLQVLIVGLSIYLVFFKNYIQEKGKNLATQEDIEEITQKIESVKSEVQHIHSQKSEWLEQSKLALVSFYDEYLHWTEFSIKNISIVISHSFSPEKLRDIIDGLSIQKAKVEKSYWRLCLFELGDTKFIDRIRVIFLTANELHNITFDYLIAVEQIASKLDLRDRFQVDINQCSKDRQSLSDTFIFKRDEQEQKVMRGTRLLMNILREKLITKYK